MDLFLSGYNVSLSVRVWPLVRNIYVAKGDINIAITMLFNIIVTNLWLWSWWPFYIILFDFVQKPCFVPELLSFYTKRGRREHTIYSVPRALFIVCTRDSIDHVCKTHCVSTIFSYCASYKQYVTCQPNLSLHRQLVKYEHFYSGYFLPDSLFCIRQTIWIIPIVH